MIARLRYHIVQGIIQAKPSFHIKIQVISQADHVIDVHIGFGIMFNRLTVTCRDIISPFVSQILKRIMDVKVLPVILVRYIKFVACNSARAGIDVVLSVEQALGSQWINNTCRKFIYGER